MRTGCPLWDLPDEFKKWNILFKRFNEWLKKRYFEIIIQIII